MSEDEVSTNETDPYYAVFQESGGCDASASTITMSEADFDLESRQGSRMGSLMGGFDMSVSTMEGVTLSQEIPRFKRSWDQGLYPDLSSFDDGNNVDHRLAALPRFEDNVPTRPLGSSNEGREESPSSLRSQQPLRKAPAEMQATQDDIVEKLKGSTRISIVRPADKPGAVAVSQGGVETRVSSSQNSSMVFEKLKDAASGGVAADRPGAVAISDNGKATPLTSQYASTAVAGKLKEATGGEAFRPGAVAISDNGEVTPRTSQFASMAVVDKLKEAATGGKAFRPGAVAIADNGEASPRTSQYASLTVVDKLKEAAMGGKAFRPGAVSISQRGEEEVRSTSQRPLSVTEKLKEAANISTTGPAAVPGAVSIGGSATSMVQKLKSQFGVVDTIYETSTYDAAAATLPQETSSRFIDIHDVPNRHDTRPFFSSFAGFPTSHQDVEDNEQPQPSSTLEFRSISLPQPQVGAVAVAGIDAHQDDEDDNLAFGELISSEPVTEGLVEALPITGDDEVLEDSGGNNARAVQPDVENPLVAAKPVSEDELYRSSVLGWMCRHKFLLLLALLAIIGVVISSLFTSGGSGSEKSKVDTGPVKLSNRFREAMPIVITVTPEAILVDPTKPQYYALKWLADVDSAQLDFSAANSRVLQRYALAVLYYATQGYAWSNAFNFLSTVNECEWNGTHNGERAGVGGCSGDGLVTSLTLGRLLMTASGFLCLYVNDHLSFRILFLMVVGNKLNGTLPEEIGSLDSLEILNLASNPFLYGKLPASLPALTNMKELRASGCSLFGNLPMEIGNWKGLSYLALYENRLTGSLPPTLGQLSLLENLFLSTNLFSGQIPKEMGALVNLRVAQFQNNQLSGSIPQEFSNLASLRQVDMSMNLLTEGAENLCDINGLLVYITDCFSQTVPLIEKEIVCPCCSFCCSHQIDQCQANFERNWPE
jgi:hypothetical protein